jgi:hypothetical protein
MTDTLSLPATSAPAPIALPCLKAATTHVVRPLERNYTPDAHLRWAPRAPENPALARHSGRLAPTTGRRRLTTGRPQPSKLLGSWWHPVHFHRRRFRPSAQALCEPHQRIT